MLVAAHALVLISGTQAIIGWGKMARAVVQSSLFTAGAHGSLQVMLNVKVPALA